MQIWVDTLTSNGSSKRTIGAIKMRLTIKNRHCARGGDEHV